jgi:hypothetical protein
MARSSRPPQEDNMTPWDWVKLGLYLCWLALFSRSRDRNK